MNKFEDERGIIEDLKVGNDWSVTYISFKKGAVRGNHYHKETRQVDYVLEGRLSCNRGAGRFWLEKGESIEFEPGTPHAYKALKDSIILSMCFGKRIGENYEEDTFRLTKKLL